MPDQATENLKFFKSRYLNGLIEADYLAIRFSSVCVVDMGLGTTAPYLYINRGDETLHLVSSRRVSIPPKRVGIYVPGKVLRFKYLEEYPGGFKLTHEVVPIMEIPTTFEVSMSWVGTSCRGFINFGPSGEYTILCVLDQSQIGLPVSRSIMTNTRCLVSIENLLGAEYGMPIVSVSVHRLL